jgi:hypothetical protein
MFPEMELLPTSLRLSPTEAPLVLDDLAVLPALVLLEVALLMVAVKEAEQEAQRSYQEEQTKVVSVAEA